MIDPMVPLIFHSTSLDCPCDCSESLSSVVSVYYNCFRQCVGIEPLMETSPVHDFGYQGLLAYYGAL